MINKISSFLILLISLIPFTLISGPAIPDITITFSSLFFLFYISYKKEFTVLFTNNIFKISLFFWTYLLIISFFAENTYLSFRDSLVFIRVLLIPILILYWFKSDIKNLKQNNILYFYSSSFLFL